MSISFSILRLVLAKKMQKKVNPKNKTFVFQQKKKSHFSHLWIFFVRVCFSFPHFPRNPSFSFIWGTRRRRSQTAD